MRITQSMILRNTMRSINNSRDDMHQIQNRISTQKKVQKASDDPISYSRAMRFRRSLEQNKQYIKNINDALSWTSSTSISLDQLYAYALDATEMATRGADGTVDADIRMQLAESVRGLLLESVNIGNSQYLGKSLFAGTMTDESEPFSMVGDVVTYLGNDEKIERRATENLVKEINTTGQELADTELFSALTDLITALEANDVTAINASMDQMQTVKKNLLTLSTRVGSTQSNLELISLRLDDSNVKLAEYISDEEDAVMEEEVVRLASEEIAYQAALQSASKIMTMNIMDYLPV